MQPAGSSSARIDLYRKITDTIIEQIEVGAGEYMMPWYFDGSPAVRPRNPVACHMYRGINVLTLAVAARAANYPTGLWATYRQWQLMGAQVRDGQKGTLIIFWKILDRAGQPYIENEEQDTPRRIVARGFWVFNAAQVDNYVPIVIPRLSDTERSTQAERFYAKLGIETRFGGDEACYDPIADCVRMPPFAQFKDAAAFYATLLHEGAHATGASHRLNRDLTSRFGSEAYAMEEMIADWAAAMACGTLQITPEPRHDHASYIKSWLKVLRGDKRAVFAAATQAQKIVDWMWGEAGSIARIQHVFGRRQNPDGRSFDCSTCNHIGKPVYSPLRDNAYGERVLKTYELQPPAPRSLPRGFFLGVISRRAGRSG